MGLQALRVRIRPAFGRGHLDPGLDIVARRIGVSVSFRHLGRYGHVERQLQRLGVVTGVVLPPGRRGVGELLRLQPQRQPVVGVVTG